MRSSETFFAHSARSRKNWEPLHQHLRRVAERAAGFAFVFGAAEEARMAGLLHDLGKYSELFTRRLEGKEKGLDHWSAGAWIALQRYRHQGIAAALAIQGHHVGLQADDKGSLGDLDPQRLAKHHPLGLRLTETEIACLQSRFEADGFAWPEVSASILDRNAPHVARMLGVRMLFSTLVDADFLETEAHFRGQGSGEPRYWPEAPKLQAAKALALVEAEIARLLRESNAAEKVLGLRRDLFAACLEAGATAPGLFTLTAPTGGGKTLAMLAFALRHAARFGLERIVVAIPYLTILEQTAQTYRRLFDCEPELGPSYVLEHHSLAGTGPKSAVREGERDHESDGRKLERQLAENWDAPLVVTTNVQILESLFSNRPRACRKLHRLARAVVLFDEAQAMPQHLAVPTLAALSHLAERYGSSVVLSTATQPAFEHLDAAVRCWCRQGWTPKEIAPPQLGLFSRVSRRRVRWEHDRPLPWFELAARLRQHGQALVIVNLKRHARRLTEELHRLGTPGLFHLSTNLCPRHREQVLADVRRRLDPADPQPCVLVSTQCVEAGVDVDFPVVYRAFGPLEAIAQAAGRCNRHGLRSEPGTFIVFRPEEQGYPSAAYEQGMATTEILLAARGADGLDLENPETFREYYRTLYDLTKIDQGATELNDALIRCHFADVAERYRVIETDAINVLVPYDLESFESLRSELESRRLTASDWMRRARPHAIGLYRPKRDSSAWSMLTPVSFIHQHSSEEWFIDANQAHYDPELLGFTAAEDGWIG